jgi:hypothetical protein
MPLSNQFVRRERPLKLFGFLGPRPTDTNHEINVGSRDERAGTIAYWVWIGLNVAVLLIGGLYFKFLQKKDEVKGTRTEVSPEEG